MAETTSESTDTQDAKLALQGMSDWGQMTAEEREADVDALIKGIREPESDTEPKPDATDAANKSPDAGDETSAGDDAVEEGEAHDSDEPSDEGEVEDEPEAEWLDGDVRSLAATMGLTDEDLQDFSSREELDRVLKILDRNVIATGKAALEEDATAPKTPPETPPKTPPETDGVLGDLSKFKLGEEFDADVAKPLNDFMEAVAAQIHGVTKDLAGLLQQQEQAAADSVYRQAVDSLHTLGHKDLFGESGKPPTQAQTANIEKAIDAHLVHAAVLLVRNRPAPPTPEFLRAAVRMEFGDQVFKNEQRQRTEKLRKQSARRTGGLSSKTVEPAKPNMSLSEKINADPEIDKLFSDLTSEQSG